MQEKLRFPSGTATAKVILMLHGGGALDEADETDEPRPACTLPVVGEVRNGNLLLMQHEACFACFASICQYS